MPTRMIDYEALWASTKLARCAAWAQAEYAWLYGLADAFGCFELTNIRVIWGKVATIRKNFTFQRLGRVMNEFNEKGLLFIWEENGKRYGHWTNSDRPGRLPPPSLRARYSRATPTVPADQLKAYMEATANRISADIQGEIIDTSMTPHTLEGKDREGTDRKGCGETIIAQASPSQRVYPYFPEFWKIYPKKVAKPSAMKAAKKIRESEWPQILADVERRKRSEEWQREGGRFIPHPATYLNQRRWEDSPSTTENEANRTGTPELEAQPWGNR